MGDIEKPSMGMWLQCNSKMIILILIRFYTEDANSENAHRAAGMTIELRDTGTYGFELPPSQV
jgi:hypothetical protein